MRNWMRRAIASVTVPLAAVALAAAVPAPAQAAPGDSVTLELDRNFADPSFLKVGATWYAFSTGDGFPVASAPDIRGPWTVLGKSMPTRSSWSVKAQEGTWDWAPDVFRRESDGRFIMYYTSHSAAAGKQCIGVATATNPAGPYVDTAANPQVCPPNDLDVLDPSPFTKLDGTQWMIYHMKGGNIRATRMTADQTRNAGDPPITLIANKPVIEAPVILRSGPRLVMFTSRNAFNDGCRYKTEAFVSVGLDPGTWTSAGTVLSAAHAGLCGPGGADLAKVDGQTWIMFHGWRCNPGVACDLDGQETHGRHRAMYVGTIGWGADTLTPRIQ